MAKLGGLLRLVQALVLSFEWKEPYTSDTASPLLPRQHR